MRSTPVVFLRALLALTALTAVACSDEAPTGPSTSPTLSRSEGRGVFHRYVAVGTSVSMGWQSDGVIAATQETSWPAQLTRLAHRELTQPYIDGTGCRSPIRPPLALGVRLSGEPLTLPAPQLSCSPLREGIELPTQNVAINAAKTIHALATTPENVTDASNAKLYTRVLPPGESQVTAMMLQNPKLVSVELGGNEVLDVRSGIVAPGITIVPAATWAPIYDMVLDSVEKVTKLGVLVGLAHDVASFPAFRSGEELWANRAEFLGAFNVAVSADCDDSDNIVFVPVAVPTAVATGVARAKLGLSPAPFSCADQGLGAQDYVLTPTDVAYVNGQLAAMNAHIEQQAAARGFAHFELDALYGRAGVKGPFSVVALMTTATPYGPYISLDGVHPSALGATVLADAAAAALNERYALGIPRPTLPETYATPLIAALAGDER